jgi:CRP/FNR family transcriptional regulator, polysaccharide utilization system transcription regulator
MEHPANSPSSRPDLGCLRCITRGGGIFCAISQDLAKKLDEIKICSLHRKKTVLFSEGAPALGVYCIRSGMVKLYKYGQSGHQPIQALAGAGDILGVQSLFAGQPHAVSAEVLEESSVCFVDRDAFLKFIQNDFTLAMKVIQMLSREVISFEERLLDLVDKTAEARMAGLLLALGQAYGKEESGRTKLCIMLSRQEMAELVGIATETAVRILSRFKKQGLIGFQGKRIHLLKKPPLHLLGSSSRR